MVRFENIQIKKNVLGLHFEKLRKLFENEHFEFTFSKGKLCNMNLCFEFNK